MADKPPCMKCGHGEFILLPHMAVYFNDVIDEHGNTTKIYPNVQLTLVVCASCAHTDWYTTNATELEPKVKGAQRIQAG